MARLENRFKKYLVDLMGTLWDVQSVEDRYSTGIPDLSYGAKGVNGWIELKQIASWPKKDDTLVKPQHYTAEQVNWLVRRGKKGGCCWVLVRVGKDEHFLFSFIYARMVQKGMTRLDYFANCKAYWDGPIDSHDLLNQLTEHSYAHE